MEKEKKEFDEKQFKDNLEKMSDEQLDEVAGGLANPCVDRWWRLTHPECGLQ